MELRPYQAGAVSAAARYLRAHLDPCLIVLPTGAGKSFVIAAIAQEIHALSGKRILVLAHVSELVEQNAGKFPGPCSIYSAGLGLKDTTHPVVFASIQSLARNLDDFRDQFALVIVDECHRIPPDGNGQYQSVIAWLAEVNPHLRVLGLTATPYRLGQGWIYRQHLPANEMRGNNKAFFAACVYELPISALIDEGFLTPPVFNQVAGYDFSRVRLSMGRYRVSDLDTATDHPSLTAEISGHIRHIAEQQNRQGVMIFAASRRHAREIAAHLEGSAVVDGDSGQKERAEVIEAFKARGLRYLINVSVLTTGFDAPHVDLIAILRPTESLALYQQIVGRGLRLANGKTDCLVLDFADNPWPKHFYSPDLAMPRVSSDAEPHRVEVVCPECQHVNTFAGENEDAHWGRRCRGLVNGERCAFFWQAKDCEACGTQNDIAARVCRQCGHGLIDHSDKLTLEALCEPSQVVEWRAEVKEGANGRFILARAVLDDGRTATIALNPAKSDKGAKYFYYAWAKPLGFSRQCWQWRQQGGLDLEPLASLLDAHRPRQVLVERDGPWLKIARPVAHSRDREVVE